MEWIEGRLTKPVGAAATPETRPAIAEVSTGKLDHSSARERILELALKHQHSGSCVGNLKAELSVSQAISRGFRQQLEAEMEENGKLTAQLKHEIEENEKLKAENEKLKAAAKREYENNERLNAALRREREENEKLNAALKCALLENANLIELTRSLRQQADGLDGLRVVLEIIALETKPKKRRRSTSRGAPAQPTDLPPPRPEVQRACDCSLPPCAETT